MKGGANGNAIQLHPRSAKARDSIFLGTEEAFDRRGAEGDDDDGGNDGNLLPEVGKAGFHFVAGGFAVAAGVGGHIGPAFENIGDVDLLSGELHSCKHFRQEISCPADKRFPLLILICAGSFADKHEAGFGVANTEDNLGPCFGKVWTDLAGESLRAEGGEAFCLGS